MHQVIKATVMTKTLLSIHVFPDQLFNGYAKRAKKVKHSRTIDWIQGPLYKVTEFQDFSRPLNLILKFQDFSRFPGPVGTLLSERGPGVLFN